MISKVKKSVSLSCSVMDAMAEYNADVCVSEFIENALVFYLNNLKKQERGKRDIEIIKANAKRLNKEAEENLKYQAIE